MKSLEKLKTVLKDVEINEEQKEALDSFLKELYESLQEKAETAVSEKISDLEAQLEEAKEAQTTDFVPTEDWVKVEEAEAAFNLAMKDAEAAFNKVQEDLIAEHSEGMTKALEDLYESLYEKATKEVLKTPQFEALTKIKEILAPQIAEESNAESLLKENNKLKEKLRLIQEEKETLERTSIIESLLEELPQKEAAVIRSYIEEAKTIDEVYERYNLAVGLLEAKQDDVVNPDGDNGEGDDDGNEEEDDDNKDEGQVAESLFESQTNTEPSSKKQKKFETIDEAIISAVFRK